MSPENDGATVALDADHAIVLFELLSRWFSEDKMPPRDCFDSPAEHGALLRVLAELESQLVAPFKAEYGDLLAAARERLSLRYGPTLD